MKKMLAIICVLLIIFIGTFIYKKNIDKNTIEISEVNKIQEYLSKIYMWQEVTEEALPKFNNINNAPDLWVWEVVKKDLEQFELAKEDIENKAIELFSRNFTKQFPKEGSEFIKYNEETGLYNTNGMGLDSLEDSFLIKKIKKVKNGFEVEIIEYLEDYEESIDIDGNLLDEYNVYVKNLQHEIISTIKSNEGTEKIIEKVKENQERFSTKKIILKLSEGNLYVESVE
ncbi:MAG: hypothetical protein HFJ59_07485 [Clostridia bacterium]|nr:hypothetical protein [Clostridia bacterium]